MTHAWLLREHPSARRRRSVDGLAEVDEVMRQLADLLELPLDCPRRACRRMMRCQGGDGPPGFHRKRHYIAGCIETGLRDTRRFWKRQRALARDVQARAASEMSNKRNLSRGAGEVRGPETRRGPGTQHAPTLTRPSPASGRGS
jgi:hypothetical protein